MGLNKYLDFYRFYFFIQQKTREHFNLLILLSCILIISNFCKIQG